MVVLGHWVVNVPRYQGGEFFFTRILAVEPWTQFLTWLFQVMPVFFFVGGFSNAASWQKARHSHGELRAWQSRRMKRLLLPTSALVLFWSLAVAFASAVGVNPVFIREGSHAALLPAWFLAVYVMVTVTVPFTQKIWERTGLWSVASLTLAAVLVDIAAFVGGQDWIRWSNYAFIWLAVHQLGYWWQRATIRRFEPAALILLGATALILLIAGFRLPGRDDQRAWCGNVEYTSSDHCDDRYRLPSDRPTGIDRSAPESLAARGHGMDSRYHCKSADHDNLPVAPDGTCS